MIKIHLITADHEILHMNELSSRKNCYKFVDLNLDFMFQGGNAKPFNQVCC